MHVAAEAVFVGWQALLQETGRLQRIAIPLHGQQARSPSLRGAAPAPTKSASPFASHGMIAVRLLGRSGSDAAARDLAQSPSSPANSDASRSFMSDTQERCWPRRFISCTMTAFAP